MSRTKRQWSSAESLSILQIPSQQQYKYSDNNNSNINKNNNNTNNDNSNSNSSSKTMTITTIRVVRLSFFLFFAICWWLFLSTDAVVDAFVVDYFARVVSDCLLSW